MVEVCVVFDSVGVKACQGVGRLVQPKVLAAKRGLLVQLVSNRLRWTTINHQEAGRRGFGFWVRVWVGWIKAQLILQMKICRTN